MLLGGPIDLIHAITQPANHVAAVQYSCADTGEWRECEFDRGMIVDCQAAGLNISEGPCLVPPQCTNYRDLRLQQWTGAVGTPSVFLKSLNFSLNPVLKPLSFGRRGDQKRVKA